MLDKMIPTGSRVYGCSHRESDWDYIIRNEDAVEVQTFLKTVGYRLIGGSENSSYGCPSEYWVNDKVEEYAVNLILTKNEKEFGAWVEATKQVTAILKDAPNLPKEVYVTYFTEIREGITNVR